MIVRWEGPFDYSRGIVFSRPADVVGDKFPHEAAPRGRYVGLVYCDECATEHEMWLVYYEWNGVVGEHVTVEGARDRFIVELEKWYAARGYPGFS